MALRPKLSLVKGCNVASAAHEGWCAGACSAPNDPHAPFGALASIDLRAG